MRLSLTKAAQVGGVQCTEAGNPGFARDDKGAYCASKAALNMFTVQLAYEFRDGNIAVNSVNPGYTATDLNANSGPQTIEEGAAEIVRAALLDPPVSGKFLETGGEIPW
jgi:NAD(P)-dependent dehydrogenase (short-subunit alcohol dehydrogenase family)